MAVIQRIRKVVASIDMFSSTQMLRYNDDTHYQTVTGGLISATIVVLVIAGFFNMISETLNRTAISYTLNAQATGDPTGYNLTVNAENKFMFGVQIQSMDLTFFYDFNAPRRYFDLVVQQLSLEYGVIGKIQTMPMVQCTDKHWSMIPELVLNKNLLLYNTWLCPPINSSFYLQGSFFSNHFSQIRISLKKCTNSSDPSHPCYPQDQIDNLFSTHGNFYFAINYINTVINPDQQEYRSYYIEPMDYVVFSAVKGSQIHYIFADYEIKTDTSIWPYQNYQIDKGVFIPHRSAGKSFTVSTNPQYIVAAFVKSSQSLFYSRQVQKLSVVFSYMGGLVGAVSALLFMLKAYNDTSLQISIAQTLFPAYRQSKVTAKVANSDIALDKQDKILREGEKQEKLPQFNLISFIKLIIYQFLKAINCRVEWTEAKEFQSLKQEIKMHLDIRYLLQRICNLQRSLSYFFDDNQLSSLKYQKKMSLQEIRNLRKTFVGLSFDQLQKSQQKENQNIIDKKQPHLIELQSGNSVRFNSPTNLMNSQMFKYKLDLQKSRKQSQIQFNDQLRIQRNNQIEILDDFRIMINQSELKKMISLKNNMNLNDVSKKIWDNLNMEIKNHFKQLELNKKNSHALNYSQGRKLSISHLQ